MLTVAELAPWLGSTFVTSPIVVTRQLLASSAVQAKLLCATKGRPGSSILKARCRVRPRRTARRTSHSVVPDRDARRNHRIPAAALLGKVDDDIAQLVFEASMDALQP